MNRYYPISASAAALVLTVMSSQAGAGWTDKLQQLWSDTTEAAQETYEENWDALPGEITLCVAKELKDWISIEVTPKFKSKAPRIDVELEAHGSGDLVNAMNDGNSMKCDILIPGSDVSALRWNGFDISKRKPVAYSATVWVGDKEKLEAARAFLGKVSGEQLGCDDLAKVAEQGRYSKISEGGKGKVDIEMTTSNSGQSMYVSCVYPIVDALDPDEVEEKLNADAALEDRIRSFFKEVRFDVSSTTTLSTKAEGQFMHPNVISYKHLAIATYESFLPMLSEKFADGGKQMEVIYPKVSILNSFPATRITTEGKNGQATEAFMRYLTGEEAQRALLNYGFRPANPKVDYAGDPKGSFFSNDIEVGDAPTSQQMLRDLWDIVGDDPKAQAVKF